MSEDRYVTIPSPSRGEGVARALQVAFRDGLELPADLRASLDRLDRITG